MTSKERVLRSIRHQNVDRTPSFYLGVARINARLATHLGIDPSDYEAMLTRLGVDVRYVVPQIILTPGEDRYAFQCGTVHARLHNQLSGDDSSVYPVGDARTASDLDQWRWPDPDWFDYTIPAEQTAAWRDKAVVAYDMGILFLYAMGVRGMEQIMIDMAAEPEMAHAVFGRIAAFNLERTRRFLKANVGTIDILGIGDDVAGQRGMIISPDMWRLFMRPYLEEMIEICRAYNVVPYFHGCGGFRELYPQFIEMGIPCTGRLQTEAAGNNLRQIKADYGKKLCLWGAIDGQHVLTQGSPDQVRAHVREVLEVGSHDGGFVAGPTHSFTDDTPIENIVAVYETIAASAA